MEVIAWLRVSGIGPRGGYLRGFFSARRFSTSGGPGFLRGEAVMTLADAVAGGTTISYSAEVQVGGLIAGVGQRMLGGVSKMMADQFFNRMADILSK